MNEGGDGASWATHVKLMSLPLLMKTSLFPNISARETGDDEKKQSQKVKLLTMSRSSLVQFKAMSSRDEEEKTFKTT